MYQISIQMMGKFHEVSNLQGSQCMCNIALRHVSVNIFAVQKGQVLNIMTVCLYSCLSCPACKLHFFLQNIILSSVACLLLPYLSTLAHKLHDFRERKKFEYKMCVLIFSTTFV